MVGLILVPVGPVRRGPPQQPGQHKRRSRSGDGPTVPVVPVFPSQVGRESWRGYTATGGERIYFITNSINNWDNWDSRANATTGAAKNCPSFKNLSQLNRDRGFLPPWSSGERVLWELDAYFSRNHPHARKRLAPLTPRAAPPMGPGDYRVLPPGGRRGTLHPTNRPARRVSVPAGLRVPGPPTEATPGTQNRGG